MVFMQMTGDTKVLQVVFRAGIPVLDISHGKGIGSRFLEAVEAWLSENGIRQIFLQTEHNVPAYQFYLNHGFHELQGHVSFAKQICR